jgi:hypothetical protein
MKPGDQFPDDGADIPSSPAALALLASPSAHTKLSDFKPVLVLTVLTHHDVLITAFLVLR